MSETPGRILGIGGIFFKADDAPSMRSWYQEKLGIQNGPHGAMFHWTAGEKKMVTVWSIFPGDSKYFDQRMMINYIVDDLDAFLIKVEAAGVKIDPKREDHEYGKFAWVFDPDGNKIELWQPSA